MANGGDVLNTERMEPFVIAKSFFEGRSDNHYALFADECVYDLLYHASVTRAGRPRVLAGVKKRMLYHRLIYFQ